MKKTGIIGAMSVEVEMLLEKMTDRKEVESGDILFHTGKLIGKDVVVARCNIGKVNAAIVTQMMIDKFGVDYVINTGIAGSFDENVKHLDVVISKEATYHDVRKEQMIGLYPNKPHFEADELLVKCAQRAAVECHLGTIVTGDDFIDTNEKKMRIAENFKGLCLEMEGAAIAHTCFVNKVPYVIIRCISDMADGSANMDYKEFEQIAAHKSADIVMKMMEEIE